MKTRKRRRPSTRSADQDAMVCPTANTIKPRTSRLIATMENRMSPADVGAIQAQLMKLKPATAAQTRACHQRILKASSNSARVNSQNTTMLPVDNATNGACQIETADVEPMA